VATDRARLGAVQSYTINATLNSLAEGKIAQSNALSSIEDLDYASETANNNRLQLLMQVGTSVLASLNQNMTTILSLL